MWRNSSVKEIQNVKKKLQNQWVQAYVHMRSYVQGRNLLLNSVALRWQRLPPWPSLTLSTQISASGQPVGWGGDESSACQEQKLAFVINQFDRAVTEQSLPATGSSTPSTFPALRMQQQQWRHAVVHQSGEETRKWSANGVGLVHKRMSVTLQSTEMRRLKVWGGVKQDPWANPRQTPLQAGEEWVERAFDLWSFLLLLLM